ncbi:hypothetical protein J5N97_009920 [Dioscorea zingiberensis]|uniref:Uncharacterized protein n=1 Tax=Dioscorea zingiberensis TaxID=325984 RepID=A0A9D5CXF1_9LILI|nr:hypothetical protein J5N97_009920 [Dioscorea zingiberensis]
MGSTATYFHVTSLACSALISSVSRLALPIDQKCKKNVHNRKYSSNYFRADQHLEYSSSSTPRRSANFKPSIWPDDYIQSLNTDDHMEEKIASRIEKLKDDTSHLFHEKKEIVDQLKFIDTLRQLGVAYHFHREIKDAIKHIYSLMNTDKMLKDDIFATSLFFRLAREYGFEISEEVFDGFKDKDGNFNMSLCNDIRGMLSLYEASYLVIEGEDTLEEARVFTTKHLKAITNNDIDPILKEHVKHALEMPLHWRIPRLHNYYFIGMYEKEDNMNSNLLEFAKLEYNMVQSIHKRELKQCSRWWTKLGLLNYEDISFSRDRLVENYLFAMGWESRAKFSFFREILTKVNCLVTVIDDIYDVYGTLNELEQFTAAVDRWDANALDNLPKYMKICFLALFNTTNDTAYKVLKMKDVNCIPYLKKAWAELCRAYFVEAKWAHSNYQPTIKEYLENGWISICAPPAVIHSFVCITEFISEEALECLENYPTVMRQAFLIFRLCDDLGTSTEEMNRGDVMKSIQCYMHEKAVSEVIARDYIRGTIREAWKKLNTSLLTTSSPFEESFINLALSIARMAHCIYEHGDGYGEQNHETKDGVISLLIEPVSLDKIEL